MNIWIFYTHNVSHFEYDDTIYYIEQQMTLLARGCILLDHNWSDFQLYCVYTKRTVISKNVFFFFFLLVLTARRSKYEYFISQSDAN